MLAVITCLAGVFILLMIGEVLWRSKILKGEDIRKFDHISVGTFIAFWPWLISWHYIQLISIAMLIVVLINRYQTFFHFSNIKRTSYGDIFLALAVLACASLTDIKIFFAIAILHLAIADGVATLIGQRFGRGWQYKILFNTKTLIGSMAFWLTSLSILAVGIMLGANDIISFHNFVISLIILPPILTLVENVSPFGLDDISVPVVALLALHVAQVA